MHRLLAVSTVVFVLLWSSMGYALPRVSLTAGTPCSACHINGQGGGMRTEIGWGSFAFVGAFPYDEIGLDSVAEIESNTYFDNLLALGVDIRLQMAKLGRPTYDPATDSIKSPDRVFIPMQIQPYLSLTPTEWLKLYGTYNVGPSVFRGQGFCNPTYDGQSCFEAAAILQPSYEFPYLRVGHIQPSIGIRHDDHTMMIRGDASAPRSPVIAPNYAEYGAELTYIPAYWLQTDFGAFHAGNLSNAIHSRATPAEDRDIVGPNDIALNGRLMLLPHIEEWGVVSWLGTSAYIANQFRMANFFLGVGKKDTASLMVEGSWSTRGETADHTTLNLMAQVDWQFFEWLVLEGRYERATTQKQGEDFLTQTGVVGLQFFPIPYVELRPEYRLIFADDYTMSQYTLQVHLFY